MSEMEVTRLQKDLKELLDNQYEKINEYMKDNKDYEITKTDFQKFLADILEPELDRILARAMYVIQPIKKGRNSKRIELRIQLNSPKNIYNYTNL